MTFGAIPPMDESVSKDQLVCGRLIDGAAVNKPGQQVKCRNDQFEIRLQGQDATSVCPTCRVMERLRIFRTAQRSMHPQQPGLVACGCGGFRFRLYEHGNALETRCVSCGRPEELGHSRSIGV